MAKVLSIVPIGKRKNKVQVLISGEAKPITACVLAIEKLRIREGADLDKKDIRLLIKESAIIEGFDKAVKYIVSRPRSEKEIRLYLLKKVQTKDSGDEAVIESDSFLNSDIELDEVSNEILNKLVEYRYIDDAAFANSYISHYKSIRGQKLLRYELVNLGVESSIIDEAFLDFRGQEDEALRLAEKWIRGKKEVDYYKLNSFLYSKGFSSDDIKVAINRLKNNENDA